MADRAAKDALYEGFAEVARALASGRRAEIADLLAQGERPVEQIAGEIGQSVANTSHHLRAMARAGLVDYPPRGHPHLLCAGQRPGRRPVVGADSRWPRSTWPGWNASPAPTWAAGRGSRSSAVRSWPPGWPAVRSWCWMCGQLPSTRRAISREHARCRSTELRRHLRALPADAEVVAYCRGPYCVYADEAVRELTRHGFRARRLVDGFPEWKRAGLPVAAGEDDEGRSEDDRSGDCADRG